MKYALHKLGQLLIVLISLFHCGAGAAADNFPPGPPDDGGVPLVIANRTIVVFRASMLGNSPSARADGAEYRIAQLLDKGAEGLVGSQEIPQGTAITIDGASVFAIVPGDLNEPAGETMAVVVERTVGTLAQAIGETRERKNPQRMLKAAGLALLAALLFAAVLYGVNNGGRRLNAWIARALKMKVWHFRIGGVIALYPGQVVTAVQHLVTVASWVIVLLALDLWLTFTLALFPYTRPWGEQLRGHLLALLGSILGNIIRAIPGLVTVAIIFAITRLLARLVTAFFQRIRSQHIYIGWLDEDTAKPTQRIAVFVLWLFALVMAYPYLPGAQTDAFKGLSVLLGIMVSIGASGIVGQVASGLILMYARALRVGDYARIGDSEGTVTELGLLTTHIQTGLGEEVILPNAFVVANITRNFSREAKPGDAFVIQVRSTIGYSTPWRQVHAILLDAAHRTDGLLAEPPPYVVQIALSDFYIEYRLMAYADAAMPAQRIMIVSALNAHVLDVFNLHGVQVMSPHYLGDPARPLLVPEDKWFTAPAKKPQD